MRYRASYDRAAGTSRQPYRAFRGGATGEDIDLLKREWGNFEVHGLSSFEPDGGSLSGLTAASVLITIAAARR